MRISSDKTDPGYINYKDKQYPKILLDGVQCQHCITADTDKGFVTCYVVKNGNYVVEPGMACYKTEDHYGDVRIEKP